MDGPVQLEWGQRRATKIIRGLEPPSYGLKLHQGMFRLDVRKIVFTEKFFTGRVLKHWNRLPRAMVESPSLEILKKRVDMALWDMV